MAGATVIASENYGTGPTTTITPTGTATGYSFSASNTAIQCSSCCGSPIKYLPVFFGGSGICPGAVTDTSPIYLYGTFVFNVAAGNSTECLPNSYSAQMIADNGVFPNRIKFVDYSSSCTSITAPSTHFQPIANYPVNQWDYSTGHMNAELASLYTSPSLKYWLSLSNVAVCGCSTQIQLRGTLYLDSASSTCSPLSLKFTGGHLVKNGYWIGTWDLTFTP